MYKVVFPLTVSAQALLKLLLVVENELYFIT